MSQSDGGYGTLTDFAAYIGGVVELDPTVDGEGNIVITASAAAVRDAGREISERGYEVEIEDEVEPARLVVVPTEADLQAVGNALDEHVPGPGDGLTVEDPADREGDTPATGDEQAGEAGSYTSQVVEVEAVADGAVTSSYRLYVGDSTVLADKVRVSGVRMVLQEGASTAFESDGDGTGPITVTVSEDARPRVAEITAPGDK